jgi:hypothetical protein
VCYNFVMDSLRLDDIRRARTTPPSVKLREALEAMELGIGIKRASLRRRDPNASEAELAERLSAWLSSER